ncbi:uncharacterized protein LOC131222665 [Magnolia sinica]|uniref:uncharacterized protein LOC131222665 n=1 Tax=Magnolia sinica TaxID=86752 RepID=UPI00265B51FE|nr:uncharacterized protein LOC131222665 [Magnolia sinica]
MASLTPGVLSKLLQHASTDVRVAGEHRTALLQVIGIVPSGGADDPLQSSGFFLKVSDSLHSTYVSISDEDADLIFSDKIQLGQFVHVARLDSASPVPVLRGVKPVPRRRPCIGNPKDLVSSDLLPFRHRNAEPISDGKSLRRASLGGSCREEKRPNLDSLRRGWERSAGAPKKNGVVKPQPLDSKWKEKETSPSSDSASVLSDKKASPRHEPSLRRQSLSNSPLKNKSNHMALKPMSKSSKRETNSSVEADIQSHLVKVHFGPRNWHQTISWDVLPSSLHDFGKDALHHRNAAFLAAVDALQEASAAESVIQSLSMFAELCETAEQVSPRLLVEQFLNLHQSMQRAATITDAMLKTRYSERETSTATGSQLQPQEVPKIFTDKTADATSWVQAALETDLSSFSLLSKQDKRGNLHHDQHHYLVLETSLHQNEGKPKNPISHSKQNPKKQASLPASSTKGISSSRRVGMPVKNKAGGEKREQCKGRGLREMASVAKSLVSVSRGWFFRYLDSALDDGFGGREGDGDGEIAGILGQLKRVNQWLEDTIGEGLEVDENVENLKKKLYRFLLENLDSATVASR